MCCECQPFEPHLIAHRVSISDQIFLSSSCHVYRSTDISHRPVSDPSYEMKRLKYCLACVESRDLNKVVDVWNESIHSHFNEHDKSATNILAHIGVFVARQTEQALHQHHSTIRPRLCTSTSTTAQSAQALHQHRSTIRPRLQSHQVWTTKQF